MSTIEPAHGVLARTFTVCFFLVTNPYISLFYGEAFWSWIWHNVYDGIRFGYITSHMILAFGV